LVIC